METVVKALYNAAFGIWNALIEIAMTLFTTSPKSAAGSGPYLISQQIFNAISDATIPIATVFFIIALYKTVVTSPPEQQAQRFLMDTIKYCMILFGTVECRWMQLSIYACGSYPHIYYGGKLYVHFKLCVPKNLKTTDYIAVCWNSGSNGSWRS